MNDNLCYEDSTDFRWKENYDLIYLSWVIRGRDGSFVKAGKYRAIFKIEDSKEYEYECTVVANAVEENHNPHFTDSGSSDTGKLTDTAASQEVKRAKMYLACPKIWLWSLLAFISFVFFATTMATSSEIAALVFFAATVFFVIKMYKLTRLHVTNSIFLSLILVTVGFFYYAVFLFVVSVAYIFMAPRWRNKIGK